MKHKSSSLQDRNTKFQKEFIRYQLERMTKMLSDLDQDIFDNIEDKFAFLKYGQFSLKTLIM